MVRRSPGAAPSCRAACASKVSEAPAEELASHYHDDLTQGQCDRVRVFRQETHTVLQRGTTPLATAPTVTFRQVGVGFNHWFSEQVVPKLDYMDKNGPTSAQDDHGVNAGIYPSLLTTRDG